MTGRIKQKRVMPQGPRGGRTQETNKTHEAGTKVTTYSGRESARYARKDIQNSLRTKRDTELSTKRDKKQPIITRNPR